MPAGFHPLIAAQFVSALANLGIPDSGARYAPGRRDLRGLCTEFFHANRTLWRDDAGGRRPGRAPCPAARR